MVTLLIALECYPIKPCFCVYDLVVSTLYKFVRNNPINLIDPLGLTPAAAAAIWATGMSAAGTEEAAGWLVGGNFNPVVDIGIGGTILVTAGWATWAYFKSNAETPKEESSCREKGKRIKSTDDVFDQLDGIKKAQEKLRKEGNGEAIRSTEKSERNVKNRLKDIADDPSLAD